MKFFFDENLGIQLSKGLKEFGEDTCHLLEYFDSGTPDETWLQVIGERGWLLITVDKRIRRRPLEKEALMRYKVGAFFLGGKSMSRWDRIRQIVRAWQRINEIAEKEKPPFAYQVNMHGNETAKLPLR
ncbi:MAG: DUF5615 family PIN-like protein [Anaerolineales bacterium]|nr:MAG: hypothetical protein EDM79_15770 [Chloroflexota bacterium]MCK6540679.1 DUF5615 family PIN-like protein [Anaerolineales bacterium]